MITTTVTPFPAYPVFPGRVSLQADAYIAQMPDFVSDVNAINIEAESTKLTAQADQAITEAGESLAESILATTKWISGTTYAVDDAVWSPADYHTYIRLTAGAGTTDPSADATNWYCITARLANSALVAPAFIGALLDVGDGAMLDVGDGSVLGLSGLDIEGGLTVDTIAVDQIVARGAIHETAVSIPASDIDCSAGTYFTKTISGATTLTVANVPTGVYYEMVLDLTNPGTNVTFFAGVDWGGGPNTLTPSGRSIIGFSTINGGTSWLATLIAGNVL